MKYPEIVDGISIHRTNVDFLVVLEDGFRHDRPRRHDVTIGQDESLLLVDHESSRHARPRCEFIEGAWRADSKNDDGRCDTIERLLPGPCFGH